MSVKTEIPIALRNRKAYSIDSNIVLESGRYVVEESQLGAGGNGAVHKCQEQASGEEYAIKFLLSDGTANRSRFSREIEFLRGCQIHNHITQYVDSGTTTAEGKEGRVVDINFCIMELADRGNLQEYIVACESPIDLRDYSAQFRGLADALKCIHERGFLHRDIKPENILISGERWMLSDFGLIAPIERGSATDISGDMAKIGPVFWMSPEATNKKLGISNEYSEIKEHSDVFQLASVFWYIAQQRHPSGILKESDWCGRKELYAVLNKALQHCPDDRYQNGNEFWKAIVNAIES